MSSMQILRCQDVEKIFRILEYDYTDPPVKSFTRNTKKTLASSWCVKNPNVCFLLAEIDGKEAGFLFGHILGPRIWRIFASDNPRHAVSLALVWALQRINRFITVWRKPVATVRTLPKNELVRLNRPFPWGSTWGNGGIIEFVMVYPEFRGCSIAPVLIEAFESEMVRMGVPYVEAHVSEHNTASIRAFHKAGWATYRMKDGDIWASSPDQVKRGVEDHG